MRRSAQDHEPYVTWLQFCFVMDVRFKSSNHWGRISTFNDWHSIAQAVKTSIILAVSSAGGVRDLAAETCVGRGPHWRRNAVAGFGLRGQGGVVHVANRDGSPRPWIAEAMSGDVQDKSGVPRAGPETTSSTPSGYALHQHGAGIRNQGSATPGYALRSLWDRSSSRWRGKVFVRRSLGVRRRKCEVLSKLQGHLLAARLQQRRGFDIERRSYGARP
jgi:hypothetical protein